MSELQLLENINAVAIYNDGGLDEVIEKIESEVRSFVPDMSTHEGRKEIASIAYKVAKSKTALDKAGKDLVSGWKEQAKKVDASRKAMRERLDALRDEVRRPLTEWEEADKARIANHEANIQEMVDGGLRTAEGWMNLSIDAMQDRLSEIESVDLSSFEEFEMRAKQAKEQAIINIKHGISERHAFEKAEAERIEAEKKAQAEREARIAKEAAERAKREAEIERRQAEKAEAERIAKAEAEKAAAIQAAKEAEERAKREAIEAAERAEAEKQAAIKAERDRIAAEKEKERKRIEAEKAAEKKKADNINHQRKINREAMKSFTNNGFSDDDAKAIVKMIAGGKIKHISIKY